MKKFDGTFSRLQYINVTDGQMDGRRTTAKIALCIASRGKKKIPKCSSYQRGGLRGGPIHSVKVLKQGFTQSRPTCSESSIRQAAKCLLLVLLIQRVFLLCPTLYREEAL